VCEQPLRIFAPGNGGHTQEVNQVAFTSDGKKALSSSLDTALILWDVETGQPIQRFEAPNGAEVRAVAILPGDKQALSGGADPTLTLWDLTTGASIRSFKGHTSTIHYVAVSQDGTRALSGSNDNKMILWNIASGTPITIFHGHGGLIRQVALSQDGSQALSASADKTIRVWDLDHGAEQRQMDGQIELNTGLFSPDGRYVLAGGGEDRGVAKLWDAATGQLLKEFPWHGQGIDGIAFSPDSKFILTGGDKGDGALILSSVETGQIIRKFAFPTFGIGAIAFTPDSKRAVTGQTIPSSDDYVDNQVLAPALKTIGLILWDIETGQPIHTFQEIEEGVDTLAISPDGKHVYAGIGSAVTVWDIESGKQLRSFEGHEARINRLSLSPDGKLLVTGGRDKLFIVWDVAAGKPLFSETHAAEIGAVAISPDGRYVATSVEGTMFVWDLQAKRIIREFTGHRAFIQEIQFNADGHTLLSVSRDRTARLWKLETLPELIAWAEQNRHFPELSCDQERLYGLELKHC